MKITFFYTRAENVGLVEAVASEDILFRADISCWENVSGWRRRDAALVQRRGSDGSGTPAQEGTVSSV